MYSEADHDDLQLAHDLAHWVAELVNGVMERNRIGTPMQAISFLAGAVQDANLADREMGMAEKYLGWADGKATA
jgi:hypothetical protein